MRFSLTKWYPSGEGRIPDFGGLRDNDAIGYERLDDGGYWAEALETE